MTAIALLRPPVPRGHDTIAIYSGTIAHRRFGPHARTFTPKLSLAYLDVDALPGSLDAVPWWSARRLAPVRFRRRDFFDGGTRPLGDSVRDLVEERLGRRPTGSIFLLAHLRTFGWLFNPVAVYYCWAAGGHSLDAIILEVTNTPWHERHWYVFDARHGTTTARTPKGMHVSPFLPMDVEYRVSWTVPDAALALHITVVRGGQPIFAAHLALRRAAPVVTRAPLRTLRVSATIYVEALRLFLRRVPLYRHPARGDGE